MKVSFVLSKEPIYMEKELSEKILSKLDSFEVTFEKIETRLDSFEATQKSFETTQKSFELTQNKLVAKVVDMDQYMKENLVTKTELDQRLNTMTTHIDGFVKLHENLDIELVALRGKYDRLESRIEVLERQMATR